MCAVVPSLYRTHPCLFVPETMDISDSLRSTQCLSVDRWGGMELAATVPPDSQVLGLVVDEKLLISSGLPPGTPVL